MKRIKLIPLAVTMLLAAPAFLTSCQEDAPEINYTMNVSVINDFTKVCLLYTSPSPRDHLLSRMPSSA